MRRPLRLLLASVACAAALNSFAVPASAEDRCGGPGRPPCTILRPVDPSAPRPVSEDAPECVVIVGGLASPTVAHPVNGAETDGFFDPLLSGMSTTANGRAVVPWRFGYDRADRYAYDTEGAIGANARSLRDFVRDLSDECFAIDIVAHSMGGAVTDRAFAMNMGVRDGVATYLPLASPHNGAVAAESLRLGVEIDARYADAFGELMARTPFHDPRSAAVRDLAEWRAPRLIPRVPMVRQRMATDLSVLRDDNLDRRVDWREYLPAGSDELEGHGGVVQNARVRAVVATAIRTHAIPADDRSVLEVKATSTVSREVQRYAGGVISAVGVGLGVAAVGSGLASGDVGGVVGRIVDHRDDIVRLGMQAWELRRDPLEGLVRAALESLAE